MPTLTNRAQLSLMTGAVALLMLGSSAGLAQSPSYPSKPQWFANPGSVRPIGGKYPGTVNVVLYFDGCQHDAQGAVIPASKLPSGDVFRIDVSGSGIEAGAPTVQDCSLTTKLTISDSAQPGNQLLVVSEQLGGAGPFVSKGVGFFALLDATAGPTPSTPAVDVMWEIMSQHVCSDDFGNHVPKNLYCIEVKIGNNSGHSLQLAGIGFKRKDPLAGKADIPENATVTSSNTSYETTRALLQSGGETDLRNVIYHSVQSVGLIMASFTPFFHNTAHAFRWSTGAAIVSGALVQGIDIVAPDLTLKELNNLDDQSFRDGKLIPNNTQVRMIVFVDKDLLRGSVDKICESLVKAKQISGDQDTCDFRPSPSVVRAALGQIVLVGETVDFIQRVVVDQSVSSQEVVPSPLATTTSLSVANGGTIDGTNLDAVESVLVGGVPAQITKQSPTHIEFNIPVLAPPLAQGTAYTVQMRTPSGRQSALHVTATP
jgi:hypothetical protein